MWGKVGLVAALAVALVAIYYRSVGDKEYLMKAQMETVLKSLINQEKTVKIKAAAGQEQAAGPRIAVGYGACDDLFVDARDMFDSAADVPDSPAHFNEIATEQQLRRMFAYFFQHGAAAERFVSDDDLFDRLVSKATSVDGHRWAIGGNAPVMALRFAREGATVLLAAKMTQRNAENLHERITLAGADSDRLEKDDVHLILEYKREEQWGKYRSPRANRFIVHSDVNNPTVSSLESFDDVLPTFNADLLVVSGLQMMDNFPFKKGQRIERLRKIKEQMRAQDASATRIHFEMASFVDESLLKELTEEVIPYADSLGMNEQELPNLYSMLKYGNITLASDSNPRIANVLGIYDRAIVRIP